MKIKFKLYYVSSILLLGLLLFYFLPTSTSIFGQENSLLESMNQLPIDEAMSSVYALHAYEISPATNRIHFHAGTAFAIHPAGFLVSCNHVFRRESTGGLVLGNKKIPVVPLCDIPQYDLVFLRISEKMDLKPIPIRLDEPKYNMPYFMVGNFRGAGLTDAKGYLAKIENVGHKTDFCLLAHAYIFEMQIEPGGSGGPVCDSQGCLQGIIFSITGEHASHCAAIPSHYLEKACRENFNLHAMTGYTSGLDVETREKGVYVSAVKPNSPAENAGLRKNDRITSIGDWVVNNGVDYFISEFAYVYDRLPYVAQLPIKIISDRHDEEQLLELSLALEKKEKSEVDPARLSHGCEFTIFSDEGFSELLASGWAKNLDVHVSVKSHTQYEGYIKLPQDGSYCFYLGVNGTGKLTINRSFFLEKSLSHLSMRVAKRAFFSEGYHPFKLELWTEKSSTGPVLHVGTMEGLAEEYPASFKEKVKPLPDDWLYFLLDEKMKPVPFSISSAFVQPISFDTKPPDSDTDSVEKLDANPDTGDESFDEFNQEDQKAIRE